MHFEESDEEKMFRDSVHEFAQRYVASLSSTGLHAMVPVKFTVIANLIGLVGAVLAVVFRHAHAFSFYGPLGV